VGKSTILQRVLERTGARFSVSATTRPPRRGETHGQDYLFVDRPTFEGMVQRGEMLEHAEVYGELYGTPRSPVIEAVGRGETIVLDVDHQGGVQVHRAWPGATFVLIVPPSREVLSRRLRERGTDSEEVVERRLASARDFLQAAEESNIYTHQVVNDQLDRAVDDVVEIVRSKGEPKR
jgi:guanylate kinase